MRSPVQTMTLPVGEESVMFSALPGDLESQRTVIAALVWQSSLRKGGSQMMWSMAPFIVPVPDEYSSSRKLIFRTYLAA